MAELQRLIAEAERIQRFSEAHLAPDLGYRKTLEDLDSALARARGLRLEQARGLKERKAAVTRRQELRQEIQKLLPHLVRAGQLAAKGRFQLVGRFRMPERRTSHAELLEVTTLMIALAWEHLPSFLSEQMMRELLGELGEAVAKFAEADGIAGESQRQHVHATKELRKARYRINTLVGFLQNFDLLRYDEYPEMIEVWEAGQQREKPRGPDEATRKKLRLIS